MQPAIDAHSQSLLNATKLATTAISKIETVKCLNGQNHEIWQYTVAIKIAAKNFLVQARANALQFGLLRLLTLGMFVQGFWYGSSLVRKGSKSTGNIVTAFMAALIAAQSIEQMLPQLLVLEKGRAAGATLKATQRQIERGQRIGRLHGTKQLPNLQGAIELQNVSDKRACASNTTDFEKVTFSYPSRSGHPALLETSLSFPSGSTTFVIGKSGSGKSTLGNLLLGLYRPSSGNILINGHLLEIIDGAWLRKNITVVQQDSILFNETLFKNVALGRQDHDLVRREEVINSIDFAGLKAVARSLPQGLDTRLGLDGTSLSGGQRQKVAIARAHLRDAPILILDEATSALDHTNRVIVNNAIREWRRGKTTIIITHVLEQILDDDFVYIFDEGRLVQSGYKHTLSALSEFIVSTADQQAVGRFELPMFPSTTADCLSPSLRDTNAEPAADHHERRLSELKHTRKERLVSNLVLSSSDTLSPRSSYRISSPPIAPMTPVVSPAYHRSRAFSPRPSPRKKEHDVNLFELIEMSNLDHNMTKANESRTVMATHAALLASDQERPFASRRSRRLSSASNAVQQITSHVNTVRVATLDRVSTIKDILYTVWPSLSFHRRIVLLAGFSAATIHAAATPIFSWAFSKLLGSMIIGIHGTSSADAKKWSLAVLMIAVADALASYCMHYTLEFCSQEWVDVTRTQALQRIIDQPRAWFDVEENSLVRLIESLDRNAEEMRNLLGRFAGFMFVAVVMMAVSITWSMALSWKFTCIGLGIAPLMYAITQAFEAVSAKWEVRSDEAGTKVSNVFNETFSNIRTVRALTLESYFRGKCFNAAKHAFRNGLKRSVFAGTLFGISDSAILFVIALTLWYGAHLASQEPKSLQDILTALTTLLFGISNVNAIVAFIPQISSSRATASRLLQLSRLPYQKSHEHTGHSRIASPGLISFRNVSLLYPSRPSFPALTGLTLDIQTDHSTALVGGSGSGKSSIASILMGLYPPTSGSVTIDNIPLRNIHLSTLRSLIAIVPQNPTIFPGTVAENICYALPERSSLNILSNARKAARAAGIDNFITTLTQGYNTLIGPGGTGLSGGQQQRIAIARAIARRPRFLILDEATSALDNETAEIIRRLVKRLQRQRIGVLAITHDATMMETCQEVVVMKEGRVVERGTYASLMGGMGGELKEIFGG